MELAPAKPVEQESATNQITKRRVLVVEDNAMARGQLAELLAEDPNLIVDAAKEGEEALKLLDTHSYSIMVTDLRMPKLDGMELIKIIREKRLPVTVIVMTGHGSIHQAVSAIQLGAYDFLTKPIDIETLRLVIQRALRERSLQDEVVQLRNQLQEKFSFHNVLSKNTHMMSVFELINHIATTNATVLIEGETGTGKEQVARAIHEASTNRPGPLVAVNCAALPESLLESELLGHEKGAFTSAIGQRKGRFEMAHTGTIFLDEIGDVPVSMQAKLLRVLQDRKFERVGGTQTIEVDVRVIAATNRPLTQMVRKGTFREDLYYRLNVVKIELPPLRERPEDIPLLAQHFVQKYSRPGEPMKRISPDAMQTLLTSFWPGNIRQLENSIERACVTSPGEVIERANLPPDLLNPAAPKLPFHVDLSRPLPELLKDTISSVERVYIRKALKKSHGNVGRCAKICGLSRRSITAKISEYKLDKSLFKET